jgi:UDP-N-acetyl-D-galactosamine dehydrogenase
VTVQDVDKGNLQIAVVGLGYVGLPLAAALAKSFSVIGYDVNKDRVQELLKGIDHTGEVEEETLRTSRLRVTASLPDINHCNFFIVTVPTPVDSENKPDLLPLEKACEAVGSLLKSGDVVVFESTVYPGVTEEHCGAHLEKKSGLKAGKDFFLGYSPERINPGDKVHTVDKITKVVAGQTSEVAKLLEHVYGKVNNNNIFVAKNIKTAEAAKVIENTQRDINIAFINEITAIFQKLDMSVYDVLEAAGTKWNFLKFQPGLVGGHCIGVDPYYLSYCAEQLGHTPEIILAGRRINEKMSHFIGDCIDFQLKKLLKGQKGKILILGVTFKEDVPDLRNSKVIDLISYLRKCHYDVDVHDSLADPQEAQDHYQIQIKTTLEKMSAYDCIVGAVPHRCYRDLTHDKLASLLKKPGLIVDIKNMWAPLSLEGVTYWSL